MPTLKPFQDYDPHEVINLFKVSGNYPINKGTFVKIESGWLNNKSNVSLIGSVGASYTNVVSERWGVNATVTPVTATGQSVIGMMLYDVKEEDENGEKLKYNPQKAAELNVALTGQACPLLTRGIVLYSGINGADPTAGATAYVTGAGEVTTSNSGGGGTAVGKFLGPKDDKGFALLKVEL